MRRMWISFCVVVTLGCCGFVYGEKRTHDIEPEDYFTLSVVAEVAVSPDGSQIAYTQVDWGKDDERRTSDLWVVDGASGERQRLTFDRVGASAPQWDPEGKYIYFQAGLKRDGAEGAPYDGSSQIWRIAPDGQQAFPVTRVEDGISQFVLTADGERVYYAVDKEVVRGDWKSLQEEFGDLTYGQGTDELSQVWELDLESWRARKIVDEKRSIRELAVSPSGQRLAMVTTPDPALVANEGWSRVDVYDVQSEKMEVVTPEGWRSGHGSPFGWVEGLSFSPDSNALAFTISFDGYPTELYAAELQGGGWTLQELNCPSTLSATGARPLWRGGDRDLCFLAEEKARQRLYCIHDVKNGGEGKLDTVTPGDVSVSAVSMPAGKDSPLAIVMADTSQPGDIFTVQSGDYRRVTQVNPQLETWKLPQISVVSWEGARGDTVEGILELPAGYKEGDGPLPMVVELHGGPTASTQYKMRFWIYGRTLLPAKGYAVFSPNYRGSTGYGDAFMTDLIGHENDIEVEDILKGVDAMVAKGVADPDRLGVMGWSNGGLLTNCVITHTQRFKAASSGAGIVDMVVQWGTEDTPGHVINYMQGLPWETPEAYHKASAIYGFDRIATPTLIHVGAEDSRCPPAHAKALFRALHRYLKVPTQLVMYPKEGHGLTIRKHRLAKMKWDLAWFDKHLMGKSTSDGEKTATSGSD